MLAKTCVLVLTQVRVDSPDLDPSCLALIIFRKEGFEKLIEKLIEKSADDKKDEKIPSMYAKNYVSDNLV